MYKEGIIYMEANEFIKLMQKVKRFKVRLQQEGITEQAQDTILKIYITDLTNRIDTKILERVV